MIGMLIFAGIAFLLGPIVLSLVAMSRTSAHSLKIQSLERQLRDLRSGGTSAPQPKPAAKPEAQPQTQAQPQPPSQRPPPQTDTQKKAASIESSFARYALFDTVATPVDAATTPAPAQTPPKKKPAPTSQPTASTPKTQKPTQSLEEQIGARWAVWVGGIALALGGAFLIRYSIEAGFFGPGVRLAMAVAFGLILLGAGEFFRRRELAFPIAGVEDASIPPILTSAGIVTLYGSVYAAFALYGFIGSGAAFALMALIALIGLAAALLHGPYLAAIGFLGAYLTPLLASTGGGDIPSLYLYLVLTSVPVIILARVRRWHWLMLSVVVATLAWGFLVLVGSATTDVLTHALYISALAALFTGGLYQGLHKVVGKSEGDEEPDLPALASFLALSLLTYFHYITSSGASTLLITSGLLVVLQVGLAWRWSAARAHLAVAACLGLLTLLSGPKVVEIVTELGTIANWSVVSAYGEQRSTLMIKALLLGTLFLVPAIMAIRRLLTKAPLGAVWWATAGTIVPISTLAIVYLVLNQSEPSILFATASLVLGVIYAYVARDLLEHRKSRGLVTAIYIIAGLASAALAFTMLLDKGWLTVALALTTLGAAYTAQRLKVWQVAPTAAVFAGIVGFQLFLTPSIVGQDVGSFPIFNWLLWGYGVPAAAFFMGAIQLRKVDGPLWPSKILDAISMIAMAVLVGLQIRHLMTGGSISLVKMGLAEASIQALMALALSIGYGRLSARVGNSLMRTGSLIIASIGLFMQVWWLGVLYNPVLTGDAVGEGSIFNLLTLGYLLPGLMVMWLARESVKLGRSANFISFAKIVAGAFLFLWLNLVVRHMWHGNHIGGFHIPDGEFYTYSAVWLGCGISLLLAGIYLRKEILRKISGALIILAVIKIFIFDTAQLEGVLRALSFIGLGAILIAIALLYQRVLKNGQRKPETQLEEAS